MFLRKDSRGYYQVVEGKKVVEYIGSLEQMVILARNGKKYARMVRETPRKIGMNKAAPLNIDVVESSDNY